MHQESLTNSPFDAIKKKTKRGVEFWMARELHPFLGYSDWRNFLKALERAKMACDGSGEKSKYHFVDTTTLMEIGKEGQRRVSDVFLDRYACYLVAMNSDTSKSEVALAQTYFAIQVRRQEIADAALLTAGEKRLELRDRVKRANNALVSMAQNAGVQNYALFHHAGHVGFYGMSMAAVKERKGISGDEELLDCVGSLELSAHEFKAQLTQKSIIIKNIRGQHPLEAEHQRMAKVVRDTVQKQIGTFPEDLPREPSLKKLSCVQRRSLDAANKGPLLPLLAGEKKG
jgi:DNA-damage-inducible protein D